jgi:predicted nucleic acid-binding Zn ribbon protein
LIQKFADAPLSTCPTCSSQVQKLLSAPAFQFKGTGWYITDYARKSGGGDGKGDKGDGAKSEGATAKTEPAKSTSDSGGASSSSGGASSSAASPPAAK